MRRRALKVIESTRPLRRKSIARPALAFVGALVVLATPSVVAAQVLLLVPARATGSSDVEPAVADALREGLGVSVRRASPTIDELALAAGCSGEATEPGCVAQIARASGARLVAVERVERTRRGHRVAVELRRASDGGAIRTMTVQCTSGAECGEELLRLLQTEATEVAYEDPQRAAPLTTQRSDQSEAQLPPVVTDAPVVSVGPSHVQTVRRDARPQLRQPIPLVPNLLFAGSVAASIGAMIAGGIGVGLISAYDTAATLGTATPDQQMRIGSLSEQRDWALAFGTGFALAGACLAVGGAIAMALSPRSDGRPRLHVAGVTDGSTIALSIGGAF